MTTLETEPGADLSIGTSWLAVCLLSDLIPERGVCALVDGHQVAVVRTHDGTLFAVGQRDPFSGAFVMSRGLVGTRTIDGITHAVLQGPLYKQAFDLATGRCLDGDATLPVWPIRTRDGVVELGDRPRDPLEL